MQRSFLKWTLACGLAAAPSFFIAMSLVHRTGYAAACGGMIAGTAVFVVLYGFVERTQRVQRILSWRFAKRTAWIGYGTRIAASIIFPMGVFLDMICGLFSVGFSQWLLGNERFFVERDAAVHGEHVSVFANFLFTTVVQGLLLNVVLLGYMILCLASAIALPCSPSRVQQFDAHRPMAWHD